MISLFTVSILLRGKIGQMALRQIQDIKTSILLFILTLCYNIFQELQLLIELRDGSRDVLTCFEKHSKMLLHFFQIRFLLIIRHN